MVQHGPVYQVPDAGHYPCNFPATIAIRRPHQAVLPLLLSPADLEAAEEATDSSIGSCGSSAVSHRLPALADSASPVKSQSSVPNGQDQAEGIMEEVNVMVRYE
ncbi:hypothetical protein Y1Q_0014633 [Alligator mississippiensis]|uniref:Uncharacterized protein n=1 Tax=Alligator mississippiensis TaxID=8496 RepID=A0A151P813_ALLMI|nr:hypothetical protein Y1Q_0014633 [Alligator mississippiensis]